MKPWLRGEEGGTRDGRAEARRVRRERRSRGFIFYWYDYEFFKFQACKLVSR